MALVTKKYRLRRVATKIALGACFITHDQRHIDIGFTDADVDVEPKVYHKITDQIFDYGGESAVWVRVPVGGNRGYVTVTTGG